MKKLIYLFIALLFAGSFFTSCKKIDDATSVEFEATYSADLQAQTVSRNMDGSFSAYATIDPSSDSQFNKYIDKIKDIEVISVSGQVVNTSTDFLLQAADLKIYTDKNLAEWTFEKVPVTYGTVLTLDNSGGQWDKVSKIANEKKLYHLSLTGSVDVDEVSFTLRVTINYRVKAKAL